MLYPSTKKSKLTLHDITLHCYYNTDTDHGLVACEERSIKNEHKLVITTLQSHCSHSHNTRVVCHSTPHHPFSQARIRLSKFLNRILCLGWCRKPKRKREEEGFLIMSLPLRGSSTTSTWLPAVLVFGSSCCIAAAKAKAKGCC